MFLDALSELAEAGLPVAPDRERAWESFIAERRRYESLVLTIAGLADAVPTAWLPAERFGRHRPPVLRLATEHGEAA